jgi:hypothetical protein
MNSLDDDIQKALADGDAGYDLDTEEGVFRQWVGIFRGKMRWMAVLATVEAVVFSVLMVLGIIEFFQAEDTKWQIFYAAGVLLLALLLLLVKLWGWMQMNRYALQREIKRLELRVLELGAK